ncbi:hypothetical protein [Streptomyces sp. MZ04]|uniref:hypothetical protein n=1 Tax=Streptomyces sp. MZ04 TaxID=2559236 RepID=UPI00107EB0C3|nr:hypothetical protein [Streptomyces sp. MZ04]TGA95517.1 hypothetical protein E2651_33980 [Streptomyces sp. MZ04]
MRNSLGPLLRRAMLCAFSFAAVSATGGPAVAAPPAAEAATTKFAERHHALRRGGVVRAANSVIRLASQRESAWAGVLFAAVDAKR